MGGRTTTAEDIPIMTGAEVRQLKERHALVVCENGRPMIAKLRRCIDGKTGKQLLADQRELRSQLDNDRVMIITPEVRSTAALVEARRRGLATEDETQ